MRKFLKDSDSLRTYLSRTGKIVVPYWTSDNNLKAWGLTAGVLLFLGAQLSLASPLSYAMRDFFDALDVRDVDEIWRTLLNFFGILFAMLAVIMVKYHIQWSLVFNWREFMTHRYLGQYLEDNVFNQVEISDYDIDNPDQRIAMDMYNVASETLGLGLLLLENIGTLLIFSVILWNVSGDISFSIGGSEYLIPGYMFWVALLYSVVITWITHTIVHPLGRISFRRQAVEADFRYQLARLRENTESIALLSGEDRERDTLHRLFSLIRLNWFEYLKYTRRMLGLQHGLSQLSMVFPYVTALPALLAGKIALGGLMQLASAFSEVQRSLSWFANHYGELAMWKASVDRVISLEDAFVAAAHDRNASGISATQNNDNAFVLRELRIDLPTGSELIQATDMTLSSGENVLITGTSGSGKTTLFRVASGQWIWGDGELSRPNGKLMFLPQKPYLPVGTLRAALWYPNESGVVEDPRLLEVMRRCQLEEFIERLDNEEDWSRTLSGGEQQRVSIVRAILEQPDWLFMDEATSALDRQSEAVIFAVLKTELPSTTFVSIAHRESLRQHHDVEMHLDRDRKTLSLTPIPA